VEQIFGIFKCEFALMDAALEYPIDKQAKFVAALGALHNFKAIYNPKDLHQYTPSEGSQSSGSQTRNNNQEPCNIMEAELGLNITNQE
jgi:hypothetical protein